MLAEKLSHDGGLIVFLVQDSTLAGNGAVTAQ